MNSRNTAAAVRDMIARQEAIKQYARAHDGDLLVRISRRQALQLGAAAIGAPALSQVSSVFADAATELRVESQVWWRKAGILVPSAVGEHIHLEVEHPDPDRIYSGTVHFHVKVLTHGLTGTRGISFIRLQDQSAKYWEQPIRSGTLVGDSEATFDVPVNFDLWPTGRREMRWTANCPANGEGNRMYQSTGYQVSIRAASPKYRTDPWIEARGWYFEHGYQNPRWLTRLDAIKPGATVKVKLAPGSGGRTTKLAIVSLNPHYHDGDGGTELLHKTAAGTYSFVVPAGTSGQKLVAIASDGQVAGVSAVTIQ